MKNKTYTQEEIDSKLNILERDLEKLLAERKAIGQEIRDKRASIDYWKNFDKKQYKLI